MLHACGAPGDGNSPYGAVIADKRGNLYGTTVFGGASNAGIVYELSPSKSGKWKEEILYSFTGGSDGQYPSGSLTLDATATSTAQRATGGKMATVRFSRLRGRRKPDAPRLFLPDV